MSVKIRQKMYIYAIFCRYLSNYVYFLKKPPRSHSGWGSQQNLRRTDGSNGPALTGSLPQDVLHGRPELLRLVQGHIGLGCTSEAAPVDPAGAPARQELFAEGQGQGHGLLRSLARRGDVLEETPGGKAGLPHQAQVAVKVPGLQSIPHGGHPAVFGIDVKGAEHGPVAAGRPELRQAGEKRRFGDLRQDLLAEAGAEGPQLLGNGGVFAGQVRSAWLAPQLMMKRA